jgi:hypothetical protein
LSITDTIATELCLGVEWNGTHKDSWVQYDREPGINIDVNSVVIWRERKEGIAGNMRERQTRDRQRGCGLLSHWPAWTHSPSICTRGRSRIDTTK